MIECAHHTPLETPCRQCAALCQQSIIERQQTRIHELEMALEGYRKLYTQAVTPWGKR